MRSGAKATALLMLLLLSVAAMAQEAKVIQRTAKAGDILKFRMVAKTTLEGKPVVFTGLIVETVKKVQDNGDYMLESLSTENKVDFGGTDVEPAPNTTTTMVKPNGEIVAIVTDANDPNLYRLALLNSLRFPATPLKVGDTWTVEVPKDDRGTVESAGSYKIEAVEKVGNIDAYRIVGGIKEKTGDQPAGMDGTYWIAVADGALVKMEGTLTNAPFPNLPPLTTKITLTREK